jgi:hypothetical protein
MSAHFVASSMKLAAIAAAWQDGVQIPLTNFESR